MPYLLFLSIPALYAVKVFHISYSWHCSGAVEKDSSIWTWEWPEAQEIEKRCVLCHLTSAPPLVGMGLFPHLARILQLKQAQWPCIVHPQVDNERWEIAFQISSQCCLLENIKYCLQVFKQTLSVRPLREPFKSWLLVSCILPLTFIIIIGSRALDS